MNRKVIISSAISLMLLVSGSALAANLKTPAESVSSLTKISEEKINEQRAAGKTYGQIAQENGVFDQFKDEMLKNKLTIIDQRVAEGKITKENAEAFKKAMQERMDSCTGTQDSKGQGLGKQFGGGMKFGGGMGQGRGCGANGGLGQGRNSNNNK